LHYIRLCSVVAIGHTLSENGIGGYLYCKIDKKQIFVLFYYLSTVLFRVKKRFVSIVKDAFSGFVNEKNYLFLIKIDKIGLC